MTTPAARNSSFENTNVTNHDVLLPNDSDNIGDRVIIMFGSDGAPDAALTGWSRFWTSNAPGPNARLNYFYRDIDGTEGFDGIDDTVVVVTGAGQHSEHRTWRFAAGTFDPATPPEPSLTGTAPSGTDTTPNPPSLTPSWGAEDGTWWAAGFCADANGTVSDFPDDFTLDTFSHNTGSAADGCAIGVAEREVNAASQDPTTFTQSLSEQWVAGTIAVRAATTTNRATHVPWAELEAPDHIRSGRISWAELEVDDAPAANRLAQVSWAELETPDHIRSSRVSWAELEVPDYVREARVSWTEFETPSPPVTDRAADVSWVQLETPSPLLPTAPETRARMHRLSEEIVIDGPEAYWPLSEVGATPKAGDYSSMSYKGDYTNGVLLGQSGPVRHDSAPLFDGINDRVVLPTMPADLLTHPVTLEAWVHPERDTRPKVTTGGIEQPTTRLAPTWDATLEMYFIIGWFPNVGLSIRNNTPDPTKFVAQAWLGGSTVEFGTFDYGAWYHIVAAWEGFGSNVVSLHVNGVLRVSQGVASASDNDGAFRIGQDERWTGYDTGFKGRIGQAVLYKKALSEHRAKEHYDWGVRQAT